MTPAPSQMRAWRLTSPNNVVESMQLTSIPRPTPESLTPGTILVQTISAGLNPADYKVAELGIVSRAALAFPRTLGMDLAGEVLAIAQGVSDVKIGDHVIGRVDPKKEAGALADYVILNQDSYAVLKTEDRGMLEMAGGAPTAALTAYQTIQPYIKPGDRVFLNGGSGGTGTFGIQIAKSLGCHVTVSCSTAKMELCKELGADEVIDYTTQDVKAALGSIGPVFALAVDNVGSSPPYLHSASGSYLLPGDQGTFVMVGGAASAQNVKNALSAKLRPAWMGGGKHPAVTYITRNSAEDLGTIAGWLTEGKLRVVVDGMFGFEEAREAFERLEKGSVKGKVIVKVRGDQKDVEDTS